MSDQTEFSSWKTYHRGDGHEIIMYRLELHERDVVRLEAWRLDQIMKGIQLITEALAEEPIEAGDAS